MQNCSRIPARNLRWNTWQICFNCSLVAPVPCLPRTALFTEINPKKFKHTIMIKERDHSTKKFMFSSTTRAKSQWRQPYKPRQANKTVQMEQGPWILQCLYCANTALSAGHREDGKVLFCLISLLEINLNVWFVGFTIIALGTVRTDWFSVHCVIFI